VRDLVPIGLKGGLLLDVPLLESALACVEDGNSQLADLVGNPEVGWEIALLRQEYP
jgi:hypothetical protein